MEERFYTVERIDGDYAHLAHTETEDEILVARALLPPEIEEGTKLRFYLLEYTIVE